MRPAERRALERLARRAGALEPELVASLLRGIGALRADLPVAEVERLIRAGRIFEAVDAAVPEAAIAKALNPASAELANGVYAAMRAQAPLMPAAAREVVIAFNVLDPRIVTAIRALDSTSLRSLAPAMRQAVRETVEWGIAQGMGPRDVARGLREIVGLSPSQADWVRNFRATLEGGPRATVYADALDYTLRDRRYDGVIRRAIREGERLSPAQVDRMVAAYERRAVALHAETHARTAAIEAQKLGQRLAWQEAQASGALGDAQVWRRWVTTLDGRERPEHAAMHGETAPLEGTYANGQAYPGQGEYNCRCTEVFYVRGNRLA